MTTLLRDGLQVISAVATGDERRARDLVEAMPPEAADQLEQLAATVTRICVEARPPRPAPANVLSSSGTVEGLFPPGRNGGPP